MKKLLLIGIGIILTHALYSQKASIVDYYNWSNPVTFELSPSPIIKGYGYYSDSLSTVFDGKRYYEHNDEYYCIESWADYYYWFTKEYWYKFKDPDLYEFYYITNNDFGMASYVASKSYLGKYYPSLVTLDFGNLSVDNNRLVTDHYLARNDRRIKNLNRQIHSAKIRSNNNYPTANLKNHSNKEGLSSISKGNRKSIEKTGLNKVGSKRPTYQRDNVKSSKSIQSKTYDGNRRPAQIKSSKATYKKVKVNKKDSF